MTGPFLRIKGISKRFPGVQALQDVTFDAYAGEALALIGANGAGKSTLMNILGGVLGRDSGSISLGGEEVSFQSPLEATRHGISFVHQEMALLPSMTIAENMYLTSFPKSTFSLIDTKKVEKECRDSLSALRKGLEPTMRVDSLGPGDQQMVEIARALRTAPRLIIFDEPTSSLTDTERTRLFDVIRQLKTQGATIIYITHFLDEVFSLCDRAVVLRDGQTAGGGAIAELTYQDIVRMMIGEREVERYFRRDSHARKETVLEVSGLHRYGVLSDITFTLHQGEVVGLWGLLGSGRTELIRALVGLDRVDGGTIHLLEDGNLRRRTPNEFHKRAAVITENRRFDGLLLSMSVRENMSLANVRSLTRFFGLIDRNREKTIAEEYRKRLAIKISSIEQRCGTLSGGNQQKVIVGRWLQRQPDVFLMDEPTRGLDVSAKSEIHEIIGELASQGAAVLVVSSDIDEIMGLSDRYLVMHQGRIARELPRDASKSELMSAATGVAEGMANVQ